jgi:hypothetical protein
MRLGLSRPALLRRVDELSTLGHIEVDGVSGGEDLTARLVSRAKRLRSARRRCGSESESRRRPSLASVRGSRGLLTLAERAVLDRANGRWDVGVIVLMSPLRETETLKSIEKLARVGLIRLETTSGVHESDH